MRPTLAVRIENTISVDDLAVFVFEQRKVQIAGKSLFELLHELFGIVMAVDADREDLNLTLFVRGQEALQLTELLRAVGSPLATIKYQDDVPVTIDFRKRNPLSVHVLECKVGRCVADFDPLRFGRGQIRPVLWT